MLKPILIALLLTAVSCSNNNSKSEGVNETQPHIAEKSQTQLQLNNGQKWKLDEATRQNLKEIKTYISQASHSSGVLNGEELQKQVFPQCPRATLRQVANTILKMMTLRQS